MKQHAPSCERNKHVILQVLQEILPALGTVLEIGSGTGQHISFFAQALPGLQWQPSDLNENIASVNAWSDESPANNIKPAIVLDLENPAWPTHQVEAVICINTIHIVAWPLVEALFAGAGEILKSQGIMYAYGPYRYASKPLEPSNVDFDKWLKQRDPASGIRLFEQVNQLASENGLVLRGNKEMPANNRSLWWQKR